MIDWTVAGITIACVLLCVWLLLLTFWKLRRLFLDFEVLPIKQTMTVVVEGMDKLWAAEETAAKQFRYFEADLQTHFKDMSESLTVVKVEQQDFERRVGSSLQNLNESATDIQQQLRLVAEAAEEIKATARSLRELPELFKTLRVEIGEEFTKQVVRNRSWLASPYPKHLRILQPSSVWKPLIKGMALLGMEVEGPLSVQLMCERCGEHNKEAPPYNLDGTRIEFTEEAVRFYLHAGIAIGMIVIAEDVRPLQFVIHDPKLLANVQQAVAQIPNKVKALVKDLTPELLAKIAFDKFKTLKNVVSLNETQIKQTASTLSETLKANPVAAISVGGNAHLHLGRLIEKEDSKNLRNQRPYGGLVRVLTDDDVTFKWVCDRCRSKDFTILENLPS